MFLSGIHVLLNISWQWDFDFKITIRMEQHCMGENLLINLPEMVIEIFNWELFLQKLHNEIFYDNVYSQCSQFESIYSLFSPDSVQWVFNINIYYIPAQISQVPTKKQTAVTFCIFYKYTLEQLNQRKKKHIGLTLTTK